MLKKINYLLIFILCFSLITHSVDSDIYLSEEEIKDFDIEFEDFELKDIAETEERLSRRGNVTYAVSGFSPSRDIISFSNFGLDERTNRVVSYKEILSKENGTSRSSKLQKTDWAHCFGMAYLTKQFFDYGNFSYNNDHFNNYYNKIKNVSKKNNTSFYGRGLWEFSSQNKRDMKRVIVPLQKKLFFSFSSIKYLFNQNQKKAFRNMKNEIASDELVLIGIKRSLTWQHILLGYKVTENSDFAKIYVYDSNYPARTTYNDVYLIYDKNKKEFYSNIYGDVTGFFIKR
ncbi:MAG: hypothetical protein ACQESP_07600 [Candidatus Muiribacteriota bacterium]